MGKAAHRKDYQEVRNLFTKIHQLFPILNSTNL